MRELIFVDTETTGLNVETDEIVELTWARREGDPQTIYFGVQEVPPFIDDLIGFTKRGLAGRYSKYIEFEDFLKASDGATMVAANPAFDQAFIQKAGLWQFHYRMLDVESYAMAKLDLAEMPGMNAVYKELKDYIPNMTEPDHTSRNDVLAMREAFLFLEQM